MLSSLDLTENELIRALCAREEHAFRQAVRQYQSGLLRHARQMVGEAIADEVVQETWIAAINGLKDFQGRSSLKTWLYGVLGNIAKTRLRKESRLVSLDAGWDDPDTDPLAGRFAESGHWAQSPQWHTDSPDELLSSEELRQCLEKILARLPAHQKSLLTLRDAEGLEMSEICNILDISETNARVLLHRARNAVHAAVERHSRGEKC